MRKKEEYDKSAIQIGSKIRQIRKSKNLPPEQITEIAGISADMLQKYENGQRKPKKERREEIAKALNISPSAIADPDLSDNVGIMHALFDLESEGILSIKRTETEVYLKIPDTCQTELYKWINKWQYIRHTFEDRMNSAPTEEEKAELIQKYNDWRWNFPELENPFETAEEKAHRLHTTQRIQELKKELTALEKELQW